MMNRELQIAIQLFVDQHTKKTGSAPTMGEINEFIEIHINGEDAAPREKFDGFSSEQIMQLNHSLWCDDSPIVINELSDEEFEQIPLFRQMEKLVSILQTKGSIKMTVKGALPMSVVREVYSVGTPDRYIEEFQQKRLLEIDAITVQRAHLMLKILKVVKVQKGVMTLTVRGKKLIADRQEFFFGVMYHFCHSFNWAYFDLYPSGGIGRQCVGFSLAMVAKYGDEWKKDEFYSAKYFKAFPMFVLKELGYREPIAGHNCYSIRTFDRFMLEFGLIEIKEERKKRELSVGGGYEITKYVKKSALFDKILSFKL